MITWNLYLSSLNLSQARLFEEFGLKLAFCVFWLILMVGNPSSEWWKSIFLLLNDDVDRLRQPKFHNTIELYILELFKATEYYAWAKSRTFSFSEFFRWMDFQPSGWISIQLACDVVGIPSMVGFPSMSWQISPSLHNKARRVEHGKGLLEMESL